MATDRPSSRMHRALAALAAAGLLLGGPAMAQSSFDALREALTGGGAAAPVEQGGADAGTAPGAVDTAAPAEPAAGDPPPAGAEAQAEADAQAAGPATDPDPEPAGPAAEQAAPAAPAGAFGGLLDALKGLGGAAGDSADAPAADREGAAATGDGAPAATGTPTAATGTPETAPPTDRAASARPRAGVPDGPRPLRRADIPDLDRRVLTLPGATLRPGPGAPGTPLPAFSVRYVYGEAEHDGQAMLAVGASATGGPEGWIAARETEDWRTMLVMQYAPKGDRGRVLFFKRRNDLIQFVRDPYVAEEAKLAYQQIEAGDYDGDYFVAIEPATDVDPDQTYLMPILDSREEMFDSLEEVKLLEVAGLNADAGAAPQNDVSEVENFGAPRRHSTIRDFRFGIVFVIDTTITMGRYIDETRAAVFSVIRAFEEAGLADHVDFGLVGYRDNTAPDPAIEYTARMFQPLDPAAPLDAVLANFQLMRPATASTRGFDEDAFAGIDLALNAMDWSPYDLRMAVLITDAGARRGSDPLAANPGYDVINILENAERNRVALSVLHLLTPEAARAGNIAPAADVYSAIARSGDAATAKYFGLDASDPQAFLMAMEGFTGQLVGAVETAAKGRRVEPEPEVASLGDALVNEVFRAQLEYLGDRMGQGAPRFYRAWAADKDLIDQTTRALAVKVFLTRQQLSALMEGAEAILSAYERQETGGGDFFEAIRAFSALASVEGAGSRPIDRAADLFPSFLAALPYRSDFLDLDADTWAMGGPSMQRELTATLTSKLKAYRDIAASRTGWLDLGAGVRAEDVYPVPLGLLP